MLIKYIDIDEYTNDFIEQITHDNPVEVIQLLKLVNDIRLGDEWYKYNSCNFRPTINDKVEDVLYIYVEKV